MDTLRLIASEQYEGASDIGVAIARELVRRYDEAAGAITGFRWDKATYQLIKLLCKGVYKTLQVAEDRTSWWLKGPLLAYGSYKLGRVIYNNYNQVETSFVPRLVDNKAMIELSPERVYALHADTTIAMLQLDNLHKPHFDTRQTPTGFSFSANLRGGGLPKIAQELCKTYAIEMDHDKMKRAAKTGSAHPLARYVQDSLQAEALSDTFNHTDFEAVGEPTLYGLGYNLKVIVDVGSKYVSMRNMFERFCRNHIDEFSQIWPDFEDSDVDNQGNPVEPLRRACYQAREHLYMEIVNYYSSNSDMAYAR